MKSFFTYFITKKPYVTILLAAVVIIGLVKYVLSTVDDYTLHDKSNLIEVPDLVGNTIDDVVFQLKSNHLKYEIIDSVFIPNKEKGVIVEQIPLPYLLSDSTPRKVKAERTIYLTINSTKTILKSFPNWDHIPLRLLKSKMLISGFKLGRIRSVRTNDCSNCVIDVRYKGKTVSDKEKLPYGTKVDLYVGNYKRNTSITVPKLIGMSFSKAKSIIKNKKLVLYKTSCLPSIKSRTDSLSSIVVSQIPKADSTRTINQGQPVQLILGKKGDL